MAFYETSAITGQNIEEMFDHCAKTIFQKIKNGQIDLNEGVR